MKIYFFLNWVLLFSLIASCGDGKLKKVEQLGSFRVLALIASDSEVAAGGVSTLQAYISDVGGNGRVINGTVEACYDPGVAYGADPSCEHDSTRFSSTYSIDTANDADLGASNLYTGLATDSVAITVPSAIFYGKSNREQFNGVAYLVIFRFVVDGGTFVAFRRIVATTRSTLNTNPSVTAVNRNGSSISERPTEEDQLSISYSGIQYYDYENVDGLVESKQEQSTVHWYVSEGEVSRPQASASDVIKFKTKQPTKTMVLVSVLRDDRGGVAVARRVL